MSSYQTRYVTKSLKCLLTSDLKIMALIVECDHFCQILISQISIMLLPRSFRDDMNMAKY